MSWEITKKTFYSSLNKDQYKALFCIGFFIYFFIDHIRNNMTELFKGGSYVETTSG